MIVEVYMHCKPCMGPSKMENSVMQEVDTYMFDGSDIRIYECPNCKHRIEVEVGVAAK